MSLASNWRQHRRKTAPQIREELSAALLQVQKLMIDMSRVDYLSSAGLRILLLLSHAGFLSFFTLVDSQQEALHAFAT